MDDKEILKNYLPEKSIDRIHKILDENNVHLNITRERKTKLGDYRIPLRHPNHRISINHNLNKYSFLITLLHEIAHMYVWEKYKDRVEPHGYEWKAIYLETLESFLKDGTIPAELGKPLVNSLIPGTGSKKNSLLLRKLLRQYDNEPSKPTVADLAPGTRFTLQGGRRFEKGEKLRTRYKCKCIDNGRTYSVHQLAEVLEVIE